MNIIAGYLTCSGRQDKHNEDSILLMDKVITYRDNNKSGIIYYENLEQALFAVADGIGGLPAGELASSMVLQSLKNSWLRDKSINKDKISQFLHICRDNLINYAEKSLVSENLGTTIAGICFDLSCGIVFNVGDSRVYRIHGGYLEQLSKDQSLTQSLVDGGVISQDDASSHYYRHVLIESISSNSNNKEMNVLFKTIIIRNNETILLCSDGLSDVLSIDEMESCLNNRIDTSVENLFKLVSCKGIIDDISIVIIKIFNVNNEKNHKAC